MSYEFRDYGDLDFPISKTPATFFLYSLSGEPICRFQDTTNDVASAAANRREKLECPCLLGLEGLITRLKPRVLIGQ